MKPLRLFILGDPHVHPEELNAWQEIIADINAEKPDAVLVLGDLTGGDWTGTGEGTRQAVEIFNACEAPWFSIIGNHDLQATEFDTDEEAVAMMLKALGRESPGFHCSFGPLNVIGLSNTRWRQNPINKNEIVIDEHQLAWFRDTLQELRDQPVLILCHAPPIGSGLMVMPELHARVGNAYVNQNHNPGLMQQIIWENPNILFWFSGHNHLGQHYRDALSSRLGVLYAHTATASKLSSRDGFRQSRVLELDDNGIRLRTYDHGMRKYDPSLEYRDPTSLNALIGVRKRMLGKRFVPFGPETMQQGRGVSQRPEGATRFVFLSDAHVVETIGPVQQRLIEWCRRQIKALDPDRLILGGDLTHQDSPQQASAFLDHLAAHGLPKDYLPGNNEGRDFALESKYAAEVRVVRLCCSLKTEGHEAVYLLETPDTERAAKAVEAFLRSAPESTPCLVFAHFTPDLAGEELESQLASRSAPVFWISGHRHSGRSYENGSLWVTICGGLDPVKVRGHLPEFLVVDWDGRQASVQSFQVPESVLASPRPRRFPLGLAYEGEALDHLETAMKHGVSAIQFHYKHTKGIPTGEELDAITRFRKSVPGSFLSLHLPNLANPLDRMDVAQLDPWMEWGEAAGVDDYTLHLPKVPTSYLFDSNREFQQSPWVTHCLEIYVAIAKRILASGARLSLENHYNKTRPPEEDELLSSRPWHLTRLIDRIRNGLEQEGVPQEEARKVGMIFDSGHAFTDAKVSKIHGLADWLYRTGPYLQLAHIHQVSLNPDTNRKQNHRGIVERYGPMINYHGFLLNLNESVAEPFPLLLEVRDREQAIVSLETLRKIYSS